VEGRRDRRVVAVLGDGSLSRGVAYEALNDLGQSRSKVLIVLNDTGRSYAPTVGLLAGFSRLRLSPTPPACCQRHRRQRRVRGGRAAAIAEASVLVSAASWGSVA
jgi:deoxyxylulose-5-phosphate synthase